MQPNVGLDGKIPVFVFPNSISFYLEDQRTHKQILTLYNPYDFPVKFNVLCTSPKKFTVVDPTGSIKPRCCVDLVIRHLNPTAANCHIQDKLRVQVHEVGNKQVIGKRDVLTILYPGRADDNVGDRASVAEAEEFKQMTGVGIATTAQYSLARDRSANRQQQQQQLPGNNNYIALAAALVCIVALLMPTEGDKSSRLPSYLHLSHHQKLIFAYALGLVTMVILRQT